MSAVRYNEIAGAANFGNRVGGANNFWANTDAGAPIGGSGLATNNRQFTFFVGLVRVNDRNVGVEQILTHSSDLAANGGWQVYAAQNYGGLNVDVQAGATLQVSLGPRPPIGQACLIGVSLDAGSFFVEPAQPATLIVRTSWGPSGTDSAGGPYTNPSEGLCVGNVITAFNRSAHNFGVFYFGGAEGVALTDDELDAAIAAQRADFENGRLLQTARGYDGAYWDGRDLANDLSLGEAEAVWSDRVAAVALNRTGSPQVAGVQQNYAV